MNEYGSPEDSQPVTWVRGHPIYAAHLIVAAFVASMLATTVLMALGATRLWGPLPFASASVLHGEAWRIATYGLVNPPSLWFAVDMAMIALFGREVERYFGRRKFLAMYGCIYLLPPVLFTLLGPWLPAQLTGETGAFALFIAFAALYPDAVMLFGVLAKWAAIALVGIFSLMALAYRDWTGGLSLWATTGFAFAFVRFEQGRLALPRLSLPRRGPRLRALPDPGRGAGGPGPAKGEPTAEVDALLDKIARSGISSLTPAERARLDSAARDHLIRREGGR